MRKLLLLLLRGVRVLLLLLLLLLELLLILLRDPGHWRSTGLHTLLLRRLAREARVLRLHRARSLLRLAAGKACVLLL